MNAVLRFLLTIAIFSFFINISQAGTVDLSDNGEIEYISNKITGLKWINIDALSKKSSNSVLLPSLNLMDEALIKINILKENNVKNDFKDQGKFLDTPDAQYVHAKTVIDNFKIKNIIPKPILALLTIILLVFIGFKKRKI